MTATGPAEEWIPAVVALDALYPHHGGYHGTKLLLADLLKDGQLDARAGKRWVSDKATLDVAWRARDEVEMQDTVEIKPDEWGESRFWLEDLNNWRWRKNRFVLTLGKRPPQRVFFTDVEFRSIQINDLLPSKRRGAGGRPIRATDWKEIGVSLITMAREGHFGPPIPLGKGESQGFKDISDFMTEIHSRSNEVYRRSHAFEVLGPIYKEFYPETDERNSRTPAKDRF